MLDRREELRMPDKVKRQTEAVVSRLASLGIEDFVNAELASPSTHLLKSPGKLLRPSLVFLGADYIGVENPGSYVDLAAAVELLHTSSLVHDDIIDRDSARRGVHATHVKFGVESAILGGDALISMAIQLASRYGSGVVDSISKAAMSMCAGEMLDYRYQRSRMVPNLKEYLKVAELKSSSLIGTSTGIAAIHLSNPNAKRLYEFGLLLGTAFQIRDDIMDFSSPGGDKERGNRLNVVNCVMKHEKACMEDAFRKASDLNRRYVKSALSKLGNGKNSSLLRGYAGKVAISLDGEIAFNR